MADGVLCAGSGVARTGLARVAVVAFLAVDQAGRAYGGAAEPERGAVDRAVGIGPAVLPLAEDTLTLHGGARHEPLDPDTDQPEPGALEPEGVVQPDRCAVDLLGDVARLGDRAGA